MNENTVNYTFSVGDPTEGNALGDNALYFMVPFGATLIYVSAAPWDDDTDLTLDVNDDGSTIITAMTCDEKDVPGEWISTHAGGSVMSIDINAAAVGVTFAIVLLFLVGESWG